MFYTGPSVAGSVSLVLQFVTFMKVEIFLKSEIIRGKSVSAGLWRFWKLKGKHNKLEVCRHWRANIGEQLLGVAATGVVETSSNWFWTGCHVTLTCYSLWNTLSQYEDLLVLNCCGTIFSSSMKVSTIAETWWRCLLSCTSCGACRALTFFHTREQLKRQHVLDYGAVLWYFYMLFIRVLT